MGKRWGRRAPHLVATDNASMTRAKGAEGSASSLLVFRGARGAGRLGGSLARIQNYGPMYAY